METALDILARIARTDVRDGIEMPDDIVARVRSFDHRAGA